MSFPEVPLAVFALELILSGLALLVIAYDLAVREADRPSIGYLTLGGFALALLVSFLMEPTDAGGRFFALDAFALYAKRLFLIAATFVSVMAVHYQPNVRHGQGEFHALLILATIGMLLAASVRDFVTLFVALELVTLSFMILVSYLRGSSQSTEAGLKYILFGAVSSAVLLYGIALLYGFAGSTEFSKVFEALAKNGPDRVALFGLFMVIAGLGFKVAAVPFHMWVPDVYEGAPTPVVAFLSVGSKGTGYVLLLRVLVEAAGPLEAQWTLLLGFLAVATLFYGNLAAIPQTNLKRLLGYSSIGQAGYVLLGLAAYRAGELEGPAAVLFYLLGYAFTNLAAFLAIVAVSRVTKSHQIADYAGLHARSPLLALTLTVALLSLGGVPPLVGFFGKFFLILAVVRKSATDPRAVWLAAVAILNVVISLYYYLNVIKKMYVHEAPAGAEPIPVPAETRLAAYVALLAMVGIGVFQGPVVDLAFGAARALFHG